MSGEIDRRRRIAELMRRDLAVLIDTEMDDPRLGLVTITAVNMSRDLKFATVYFTLMDDDADRQVAETILHRASAWLRKQLCTRMDLRVTPRLKFKFDGSVERGNRLSHLIDEAVSKH